jgi:hypothetical protein
MPYRTLARLPAEERAAIAARAATVRDEAVDV